MDALATGRRIKRLTCVNDFTKECLTATGAFGISGVQVTRILYSIALFHGYPATIRTDHGLFTPGKSLMIIGKIITSAVHIRSGVVRATAEALKAYQEQWYQD